MAIPWLSLASVGVVSVSVLIAWLRYLEYRNEVQRSIYTSLVGTEYEFEYPGEEHTFRVVNVDVGGGKAPWNWSTMVIIEFDIEEFPWDYSNKEEMAEKASEDLRWRFGTISPGTIDIVYLDFFETYNAPGLMVAFPTTNLFEIKEFLRQTSQVVGSVLHHYEEGGEMSFRETAAEVMEINRKMVEYLKEGKGAEAFGQD